jgi:hypothetical protein
VADIEYLAISYLDRKALARVFSKIQVDHDTGCWLWTGSSDVYGAVYWNGRMERAHRFMYAWLVSPLPRCDLKTRRERQIDHVVCSNTKCCNPAHLALVTQRENVLRSNGRAARFARQTHCVRGHKLPDAPNEINNRGRAIRRCMKCRKAYYRALYLRRSRAEN